MNQPCFSNNEKRKITRHNKELCDPCYRFIVGPTGPMGPTEPAGGTSAVSAHLVITQLQ